MLAQQDRSTTPLHLVSAAVSTSPGDQVPGLHSVRAGLTSKRPRRQVENDEYGAFARRILRAYARRVGDGNVEALALMLGLAEEIDTAIAGAVKGLRAFGYSRAEIGSRLGITRQAAQQRWGTSCPAGIGGVDQRARARCVPDRVVNPGNWQSLTDTPTCLLTCARTGPSVAAHVLLSSSSGRAIF